MMKDSNILSAEYVTLHPISAEPFVWSTVPECHILLIWNICVLSIVPECHILLIWNIYILLITCQSAIIDVAVCCTFLNFTIDV